MTYTQSTIQSCLLILSVRGVVIPLYQCLQSDVCYSVIERLDEHRNFIPIFRDMMDQLMEVLGEFYQCISVSFYQLCFIHILSIFDQ